MYGITCGIISKIVSATSALIRLAYDLEFFLKMC